MKKIITSILLIFYLFNSYGQSYFTKETIWNKIDSVWLADCDKSRKDSFCFKEKNNFRIKIDAILSDSSLKNRFIKKIIILNIDFCDYGIDPTDHCYMQPDFMRVKVLGNDNDVLEFDADFRENSSGTSYRLRKTELNAAIFTEAEIIMKKMVKSKIHSLDNVCVYIDEKCCIFGNDVWDKPNITFFEKLLDK